VKSNGEVIRVPEGATGPSPAESGRGFQFAGGSGGAPLDSRVAGVRVMDPGYSGKYLYPNGYVSYFNESGQTVNPFTGQTGSGVPHLPAAALRPACTRLTSTDHPSDAEGGSPGAVGAGAHPGHPGHRAHPGPEGKRT
jgi:hypothetical protein